MISKWSQDERRRRKAELAAQPHPNDLEILDLMNRLRPLCGGYDYMDNLRAVALHALWREIENTAKVFDRESKLLLGHPEQLLLEINDPGYFLPRLNLGVLRLLRLTHSESLRRRRLHFCKK